MKAFRRLLQPWICCCSRRLLLLHLLVQLRRLLSLRLLRRHRLLCRLLAGLLAAMALFHLIQLLLRMLHCLHPGLLMIHQPLCD